VGQSEPQPAGKPDGRKSRMDPLRKRSLALPTARINPPDRCPATERILNRTAGGSSASGIDREVASGQIVEQLPPEAPGAARARLVGLSAIRGTSTCRSPKTPADSTNLAPFDTVPVAARQACALFAVERDSWANRDRAQWRAE